MGEGKEKHNSTRNEWGSNYPRKNDPSTRNEWRSDILGGIVFLVDKHIAGWGLSLFSVKPIGVVRERH